MLDIHRTDDVTDTKIYASHSLLPTYIDPRNVSTKKKPFCTFYAQSFSHTLDLVLPEEIYALISAELDKEDGVARGQYARVYMRLGDVLSGEFFNEYIKTGNVSMRSEGRPLVDNVFELVEGVLRLEVDRVTYERCGLQGRPVEDGGRKHQKGRWVIEFNLRSPSMVHGKKGFSRLEWACKNVLNHSLTWLFYNFNPSSRESLPAGQEPISAHHPFIHKIEPIVTRQPSVIFPKLTLNDLPGLYDQEDSLELLEYLQLLCLESDRLGKADNIDPHLSRYAVPDFGNGYTTKHMVRVRWVGFIPPQFIRDLFLVVSKKGLKAKKGDEDGDVDMEPTQNNSRDSEDRWFSMNANALGGGRGWSVMQWAGRETLVWEGEE